MYLIAEINQSSNILVPILLALLGSNLVTAITTTLLSAFFNRKRNKIELDKNTVELNKLGVEVQKIEADIEQGNANALQEALERVDMVYGSMIDRLTETLRSERREWLEENLKAQGQIEKLMTELSSLRSDIVTLEQQISMLHQGIKTLTAQLEEEGIMPAFVPMPPSF